MAALWLIGKGRAYVGDLKFNRILEVDGREVKASAWVKGLSRLVRTKTLVDGKEQWYYTTTLRIPGVTHKVRIVVLWKNRDDAEPAKILITNRTYWETHRVVKSYRKRWTGTETFHRDGKQELGMGDCQLRSGQGQTRHMYLVFVAYSLLMRQLKHVCAEEWAHTQLMTIGHACRTLLRHTLGKTVAWAIHQFRRGFSIPEIKTQLALL